MPEPKPAPLSGRPAFIAVDAYSRVGGLQAFNRRVIRNLGEICKRNGLMPPLVHCLGDQTTDFTGQADVRFKGFGKDRKAFILETLKAKPAFDVLLIGHINLLPSALIVKLLHPHLKTALFVHGEDVWNGTVRPRKAYEPWLLKFVDRIASVSQYTADVMAREYKVPKAKFQLLPNAVDAQPENETPAPQTPTVLAVTRLAPHDVGKHIDKLIIAVGLLAKAGKRLSLQIIGDGVLRPDLEAQAKALGLGDTVHFLGRVDDAKLEQCYREATVFCLPSSKEGFGIVYLEAWLRGLPVICGLKGASHEIISDGIDGFAVDELDPQAIADKIGWLLDHPAEARTMGKKGREKVLTHYADANFGQNLTAVLEGLEAKA